MQRPLLVGAIVGVMAGCGGTEGGASTEASGSPSTSASTNASSIGTTGNSNGGAGGTATASATLGATSSGGGGGNGAAQASSGSGGSEPVLCGDVACGPPLQARVIPPGGLAQLSGAGILVCVDEWCASGTFPVFSIDGVSGFVNEASFVTDAIDEGAGGGGYFVEAYTDDYDQLVISHESVVGERISVEFTSEDTVLGRVSGTLTQETIESECLTCTTYTFVNLPE